MTKIIKAPNKVNFNDGSFKVFLGGSIEMGKAEPWQERIENDFANKENFTILNPRRDDWDSSWEQKIENEQFREQVEWELECQDKANLCVYYFDPKTKSPITLMELGLYAHKACVVFCPEEFWRSGNVDIVCKWNYIPQVDSYDNLVEHINQTYTKNYLNF